MLLEPGTATKPSTTSAEKHDAANAIRTEESVTIFVNSFRVGHYIISARDGMRQLWARWVIDDDHKIVLSYLLVFFMKKGKEKRDTIISVKF
jgi:hypothetical protein